MQEFSDLLIEATQAIEPGYFQLDIDGAPPVYRERVYCYELYHQLRTVWPKACGYYLNGEVDKAGHAIFSQRGIRRAVPDFLVHTPGYMNRNYAVIEVKSADTGLKGIGKDLNTLSIFVRKADYKRAIYLIYGYECDDRLINRVRSQAEHVLLSPVELWLHSRPGTPAILHSVLLSAPSNRFGA